MSGTDVQRKLEIAIGNIQQDNLGDPVVRNQVLQFLRDLVSQIKEGKMDPNSAYRFAAEAVAILTHGTAAEPFKETVA